MSAVGRGELPGPGTQHPLHKVSRGEEKQHKQHPRKFPGDHGDVVVSGVHELLATGDGMGVVPLRAADLVIMTKVLSASSDGANNLPNKKAKCQNGQCLVFVENHPAQMGGI